MTAEDTKMTCKDGVCSLERSDKQAVTESTEATIHHDDAVIQVTVDNFDTVVKHATKPVIVDFYATWCQPCTQVKPLYAEIAHAEKDWIFAAVDVDKSPALMTSCGVQAMPTFVVFKNGVLWGSIRGALPKEQLLAEFKKIIDSPAPAVHAQVDPSQQLIMAIFQKNYDEFKKLIDDGTDVNSMWETPHGVFTPLQIATVCGTAQMIDDLFNSGAVMTAVIEESIKTHIGNFESGCKALEQWFEYAKNKIRALGAPVIQTAQVSSPELRQQFMMAMQDATLLKKLIDEGADVNMVFAFGKGEVTPLYLAIALSNKNAIDMLTTAGASLSIEIAGENGDRKTIEELIASDIESYHQAVAHGHDRLAYVLKKFNSLQQ